MVPRPFSVAASRAYGATQTLLDFAVRNYALVA